MTKLDRILADERDGSCGGTPRRDGSGGGIGNKDTDREPEDSYRNKKKKKKIQKIL